MEKLALIIWQMDNAQNNLYDNKIHIFLYKFLQNLHILLF